jgi:hypothetical protein
LYEERMARPRSSDCEVPVRPVVDAIARSYSPSHPPEHRLDNRSTR